MASLDITAGQLLTTVNYCVSNNNGPGISVSYIVNNGSKALIQRMTLKLEKALWMCTKMLYYQVPNLCYLTKWTLCWIGFWLFHSDNTNKQKLQSRKLWNTFNLKINKYHALNFICVVCLFVSRILNKRAYIWNNRSIFHKALKDGIIGFCYLLFEKAPVFPFF